MNRRFHKLSIKLSLLATLTLLGLSSIGCHSSASSSTSGAASGLTPVSWNGTQTVAITDPQFNMTASTLAIPSGWKFAGQIVRVPGCHGTGATVDFTALAQDGVTAIVALPGVRWTASAPSRPAANSCAPIAITTPDSFLVNIAVPNMYPGAKIESVLALDAAGQASIAQQLTQMQQQNANAPAQLRASNLTLSGARVRVQYTRNNLPVEEMLTVVVSCSQNSAQGNVCTSRGISFVRAPQGQLDAVLAQPTVQNMVKSLQANPQWVQRNNQAMMNQFQAASAQNSRMFSTFMRNNQAQFNQSIANDKAQDAQRAQGTANAMAADRATQNSIDAAAHNTVNYSLDQKDYVNPSNGQTITASSQYNQQWISSDSSTLIQSNDPTYDPNGQVDPVRESWTELVPK
jgi:hypothetical protein